MIRVHTELADYGNTVDVWVLEDAPGQPPRLARVVDGQLVFEPREEGVIGAPTLRLYRRFADDLFAALEGYRDRNETAESVLVDALDDTREVRDRLLAMLEDA